MLYEDTMTRVHRQEDGTTSIVDTHILQLETLMPKKQVSNESPRCSKGNFNLRIESACPLTDSTDDEDADGKIFCLKYL